MAKISFLVCIGVRGPIKPGSYDVGDKSIEVSYPETIRVGNFNASLPKSLSTLFKVDWDDPGDRDADRLRDKGFARHLVVYEALAAISELFTAFKLVRIGHSDGLGIRTIGRADTLLYTSFIDGVPTGNLNTGLKNYDGNNAWIEGKTSPDPHDTTALALPHIGAATQPTGRRFVRCFELLEHGFYAEAFIVAFSIVDDFVQATLHSLLEAKGFAEKEDRDSLLRGIKENRLKLFLGPVLKLCFGSDLKAMWGQSDVAIGWLNKTRNRIAHSAAAIDYSMAAVGIFGCLKTLVVLRDAGAASVDISVELFRHAKLTAAWSVGAPTWVPTGAVAEAMDFSS